MLDLERRAQHLLKTLPGSHPERAELEQILKVLQLANKKRKPKESDIKVYPEIPLDEEWTRQADILTALFAQSLGISKDDYRLSLPGFPLMAEEETGRFDIPLIVEARLQPQQMLSLIGLPLDGNAYIKGV